MPKGLHVMGINAWLPINVNRVIDHLDEHILHIDLGELWTPQTFIFHDFLVQWLRQRLQHLYLALELQQANVLVAL